MLAAALDHAINRSAGHTPAQWPAGTRMVQAGAAALRVRDTGGKGPVLLMVPDGPNVIEHHSAVIEQLAAHARVICFDMPGFGQSRPPARYAHTVADGASVVLAVMDALDVKEAALLFSCANGYYALAAAKLAPQRIRALILCQTPSADAIRAWTEVNVPRPLRVPVVGQAMNRLARDKLMNVWYSLAVPDRALRPAFRATAKHSLDHGGCFCLAGVVQGLSRMQSAEVSGVQQPVTLLWGDSDHSHRNTRAESLLDLVPHARIEHYRECGHFPDLERPQQYAALALAACA